jgi:hypothetical protein
MDSEYLKVSPFKLSDEHYLFFDIFYKNDLIYIIAPFYHSTFPNFSLLKAFQEQTELELVQTYARNAYEPICVLVYKPNTPAENITVDICYEHNKHTYHLKHYRTTKTDYLVQTTLCLHDLYLVNMYCDYHTKMGVEKFYMYYNGAVTDDIRNKFNKENVILIEWNFHFFNNLNKHPGYYQHHAIPGHMQHALYKYGKDSAHFMLFNDLDEYVYIKNNTLQNLLLQNPDCIYLNNAWSRLSNNSIPSSFPTTFLTSQPVHYERSKCIHNTDSVELVTGHYWSKLTDKANARGYNGIHNIDNISLHFCNWSRPDRTLPDVTFYEMTL